MSEILRKRSGKAIVIHPPTMRALILHLNADERAKRSTPEKEFDEWHISGGSLEPEDNGSTEAAAVREVKEETKLAVRALQKIGESAWDAFYNGAPAHFEAEFYLCVPEEDSPEPPTVTLDRESSDSAWILEAEIPDYIPHGLTVQAVELIPRAIRALQETMHG